MRRSPTPDLRNPVQVPQTSIHLEFAQWVVALGRACELDVTVEYIDNPNFPMSADRTPDSAAPTVSFNVAYLPEHFLLPPFNRPEQLELALHEFGHAVARLGLKHGPRWRRGVAAASVMVAHHLSAQAPGDS